MSYPLNKPKFFSQKSLKEILHSSKIPMYGIRKGLTLAPKSAEVLVNALKSWAKEHGATHFSYWSYLPSEWELKTPCFDIESLETNCLIHKSIEIKSLNENRIEKGYATWDSSFPPFLAENENLETILYLPALIYFLDHQVLDQRTPFLRSYEIFESEITRLLNLCKIDPEKADCCLEIRWDAYVSNALNIPNSFQKTRMQSYLNFLSQGASFYEMVQDQKTSLYQLKIPKEKGVLSLYHMQLLLQKMSSCEKEQDNPLFLLEKLFQNGINIQLEWQFLFKNNQEEQLLILIFATAISYALYEYKELYQCLMVFVDTGFPKSEIRSFFTGGFGDCLNAFIETLIEGNEPVRSLRLDHLQKFKSISEKNEQALCKFNGRGFVFEGFASLQDLAFAMTIIQATLADSLHLILDEISDVVKKDNLTNLSSVFAVLKSRLLEVKSEKRTDENANFNLHPDVFSHLLDAKTIRVFGNILSENELRALQKRRYKSYARKMKLRIEKTLDLCKSQISSNMMNLSKQNESFLLHLATLERILEQSSDLGEEVQSKLFFELAEPAIASVWELLKKN